MIDKLYEEYGRLIIKLEALNNSIMQVKQQILDELKKQSLKPKVDK